MRKIAVILAGGEGLRAGGDEPKQFRELGGKPMLYWSVKAFADEDRQTRILVVIHPGFREEWAEELKKYSEEFGVECEMICGGRTRFNSVDNALMDIEPREDEYIAVHDAARPLLSVEMIRRGWKCASENGTAVPVLPMTDSIRRLDSEGSESVDRSDYVRVQTPQIFLSSDLKRAYSVGFRPEFTDDASVIEAAGFRMSLYKGDEDNMKVTHPSDFVIAEVLLRLRSEKHEEIR